MSPQSPFPSGWGVSCTGIAKARSMERLLVFVTRWHHSWEESVSILCICINTCTCLFLYLFLFVLLFVTRCYHSSMSFIRVCQILQIFRCSKSLAKSVIFLHFYIIFKIKLTIANHHPFTNCSLQTRHFLLVWWLVILLTSWLQGAFTFSLLRMDIWDIRDILDICTYVIWNNWGPKFTGLFEKNCFGHPTSVDIKYKQLIDIKSTKAVSDLIFFIFPKVSWHWETGRYTGGKHWRFLSFSVRLNLSQKVKIYY